MFSGENISRPLYFTNRHKSILSLAAIAKGWHKSCRWLTHDGWRGGKETVDGDGLAVSGEKTYQRDDTEFKRMEDEVRDETESQLCTTGWRGGKGERGWRGVPWDDKRLRPTIVGKDSVF